MMGVQTLAKLKKVGNVLITSANNVHQIVWSVLNHLLNVKNVIKDSFPRMGFA